MKQATDLDSQDILLKGWKVSAADRSKSSIADDTVVDSRFKWVDDERGRKRNNEYDALRLNQCLPPLYKRTSDIYTFRNPR